MSFSQRCSYPRYCIIYLIMLCMMIVDSCSIGLWSPWGVIRACSRANRLFLLWPHAIIIPELLLCVVDWLILELDCFLLSRFSLYSLILTIASEYLSAWAVVLLDWPFSENFRCCDIEFHVMGVISEIYFRVGRFDLPIWGTSVVVEGHIFGGRQ
jgi:hypothetical protein